MKTFAKYAIFVILFWILSDILLYVGINSQHDGSNLLETRSEVKLINSDKKEIKDISISYEGSNAKIAISDAP